jgi:hypothetical protein
MSVEFEYGIDVNSSDYYSFIDFSLRAIKGEDLIGMSIRVLLKGRFVG